MTHLKIKQATAIKNKLLTDKTSSDQELADHFVNVIGIPVKMAWEYLASRKVYQTDPVFIKEAKTISNEDSTTKTEGN